MLMTKFLHSILQFVSYQNERYLAEECRGLIFITPKRLPVISAFKTNIFHWYLSYLADIVEILYMKTKILRGKHQY